MFRFVIILFLCGQYCFAQQKIHVQRTDNRFLFYQLAKQNDTITSDKNDLFFMKLPDSLQQHLVINIENAKFNKLYKDSLIYRLQSINGMKYSHQKTDTVFTTLLEGVCLSSKQITFSIYNKLKQKEVFRNLFWVK